jgi:hypothetical protein
MCLHKCFENTTLKAQDALYNVDSCPISYCNGSRHHGCEGCCCRYPVYNSFVGRCKKCCKMLYELLDLLWEIRQDVYRCFPDLPCISLIEMELEIEMRITEAVNLDSYIARSELMEIYRDAATAITKDVIDRKMKQFHPVCACHSTRTDSSPANADAAPI